MNKSTDSKPQSEPQNTGPETPESKVAELEASLKKEKDRYLYLYAEFENYKKRTFKEAQELRKYGWEHTALELLGVLDNLQRAIDAAEKSDPALLQGIQMVFQLFESSLAKSGVRSIQAKGTLFDPHQHEATEKVPSEEPEGTIIEEQLRGYFLHDRLLRPAKVVISSGPKGAHSTTSGNDSKK